jgi:hypothetical protein
MCHILALNTIIVNKNFYTFSKFFHIKKAGIKNLLFTDVSPSLQNQYQA